jgi:catechol 2,3-dioxygenase-like lactoylglutathione lyase family enzyme
VIERFDHAVIAVRDLDAATESFRALGFGVEAGGRHTGLGTWNAIIRFGLDYLELISVDDAQQAVQTPRGATLVEYLQTHPEGPLGFALAVNHIDVLAERVRRSGMDILAPFAMERMRPDGRRLSWSLLVPGQVAWRRPWPFFIEWDTPDDVRLSWEPPARHANGAVRVAGVTVAVDDFDRAMDLYARQIGLAPTPRAEFAHDANQAAGFSIGQVDINILHQTSSRPTTEAGLNASGGLLEIVLQTDNLNTTISVLDTAGAPWEIVKGDADTVRVLKHLTDVRLAFTARVV